MLNQSELLVLGYTFFKKYKQCIINDIAKTSDNTISYFTPHDASHFHGVQNTIEIILSKEIKHRPFLSESDIEKFLSAPLDTTDEKKRYNAIQSIIVQQKSGIYPVNGWEKLVLYFCAWSHDIGMLNCFHKEYYGPNDLPEKKEIRDSHDLISSYIFKDRLENIAKSFKISCEKDQNNITVDEEEAINILNISPNSISIEKIKKYLIDEHQKTDFDAFIKGIIYIVNLVSLYHRRAENILLCPKTRTIFLTLVRTRLLAAIFRLSDALNVDRSRFSEKKFEEFRNMYDFDSESRLHWIKSFVVSAIELKDSEHEIEIQIDVPFRWSKDKHKRDWRDRIENLANFIVADLKEDILSVSAILYENEFPLYLDVKCLVHQIPSMDYETEVWDVLNDLVVSSSPNTSRLIETTITELFESLPYLKNITDEKQRRAINRYKVTIENNLSKRPCHVALRKILVLLRTINEIQCQKYDLLALKEKRGLYIILLECLVETVKNQRSLTKKKINEPTTDIKNMIGKATDIILYGFSQLVSGTIKAVINSNVSIHILECRTKTQYTRTNKLIYHDAYRYAKYLKEDLTVKNDITIYPDAHVAGLISELTLKKKKPIVLFGANATTTDGTFAHSMGHLAVAEIANLNKVPVYLITDSMKVGKVKHELKERNQNYWLSMDKDIINNLLNLDIRLSNPNEDTVKAEYIDRIIVSDQGKIIKDFEEEKEVLAKYEEAIFNDYKEHLEKMIIAGKLRERLNSSYPDIDDIKYWYMAEEYITYKLKNEKMEDLLSKENISNVSGKFKDDEAMFDQIFKDTSKLLSELDDKLKKIEINLLGV